MKKVRLVDHRLYNTWKNERRRCRTQSNPNFKHYGGRGISIHPAFEKFVDWLYYVESLPNCGREGYTLDRVMNDANYEPMNLRWADQSTQCLNTRVHKTNTSGFRGVRKKRDKWQAYVHVAGVQKSLGCFATPEEAYTARCAFV